MADPNLDDDFVADFLNEVARIAAARGLPVDAADEHECPDGCFDDVTGCQA